MTDRKHRDRTYAVWHRGDRQLRLALTVLADRPVLDLRIGYESGAQWVPSPCGAYIEPHEIEFLIRSLRKASADIKRFDLGEPDQQSRRARPKRKRWGKE
jgi:hypothetical protein